ncbi:HPP family protein [Aliihoeflea sp. 40Bstr573]|uniref:HPP family protein n=1 Tax=Aliihoeflea sp. 40Bstr573 TaxID=2696467 RepID=UPI0020950EE3|nr:HPP family protein [Aliihoeflea sp. 40Bstr573]MCO6386155.1 HPP family protein [Aliihoeflea sp. 40Bstr573]
MRRLARILLSRHETPVGLGSNIKAGIGAALGMTFVGYLASATGLPLLLAPLGATAVLLFGQPSSPLAQPINVMLGFLVGTIICELSFSLFPGEWLAAALALGVTIVAMRTLRVTHPPAGAMPILTFGDPIHGLQLFSVVLIGCVVLIALAVLVHNIPPKREYPLRAD